MTSLHNKPTPNARRKTHSRRACHICSPLGELWCSVCHKHLPVDEFSLDDNKVYGRNSLCKKCQAAASRKSYHKDPIAGTFKTKTRLYGLTLEKYTAMYEAQQGRCAICGREETATWRGKVMMLCIDHCHTTNKIRGLLCSSCNHVLGHAHDDINVLMAAIQYLQQQ